MCVCVIYERGRVYERGGGGGGGKGCVCVIVCMCDKNKLES